MAYSEDLAQLIRPNFSGRTDVVEKKMFGGLAFMLGGHLCCGVAGDELMVRVGSEAYDSLLRKNHVRGMDFTGRPVRGMIYVALPRITTEKQLNGWISHGLRFVSTLPPKM